MQPAASAQPRGAQIYKIHTFFEPSLFAFRQLGLDHVSLSGLLLVKPEKIELFFFLFLKMSQKLLTKSIEKI